VYPPRPNLTVVVDRKGGDKEVSASGLEKASKNTTIVEDLEVTLDLVMKKTSNEIDNFRDQSSLVEWK
jgi:hypothetical protein